MTPDHAAREQHRAAGTVPLLEDDAARAELARAGGRDEAGHAGAGDEVAQVSENDGLCSTYSSLTRSGPPDEERERVRRVDEVVDLDAEVLASAWCSSTESTRTPRWLSSGRSGSPGSPCDQLEEGAADLEPPVARSARSRAAATRGPPPPDRRPAARRGRGRARSRSPPRRATISSPSPRSTDRVAAVERGTREPDPRASAPRSRGPSASKSVSLPRRASAPSEREPLGLLDHAQSEPLDRERRHLRRGRRPRARRGRASAASRSEDSRSDHVYFRRSTARCSCALFIFERPSMPMSLASS